MHGFATWRGSLSLHNYDRSALAAALLLGSRMRSSWIAVLLCCVASPVGCGGTGPAPDPSAPKPGGYLVYVRDREGSVLAAIDDQGKTISTTTDDGFGLRLSSTGTPVPREFLDQELDEETGYLHFKYRYYDPATAQWISPDPKLLDSTDCSGRVQGCNPYQFAGNRPLEWTDPDGREAISYVENGREVIVLTLAFIGPDRAQAQQLFLDSLAHFQPDVRVIAYTATYKSVAEVPAGRSIMNCDHLLTQTAAPGYHGSEADVAHSRVQLSADAQGTYAKEVTWHEIGHLLGLLDLYSQEGGDQHSMFHTGSSLMNRFFDRPPSESGFRPTDQSLILFSAGSQNQGMDHNDPSWGAAETGVTSADSATQTSPVTH